MIRAAFVLSVAVALVPFAATALPTGAPWAAVDDPGQACASCHFGSPPVDDSGALTLAGVKGPVVPGATYRMTLRFAPEGAQVAGFLAAFRRGDGDSGSLTAGADLEANGGAIRSTAARAVRAREGTTWTFDWTAPQTPGPVAVQIAATAGSDDASPLGDVVHLKRLAFEVVQKTN